MRRRSRLAVTLVALLTVGAMIVGGDPRDPALAADPIQQAKAERASIQAELAEQRARLDELRAKSARLSTSWTWPGRAGRRHRRVRAGRQPADAGAREVHEITDQLERPARADRSHGRPADGRVAGDRGPDRGAPRREALLQDHMRSAYERSQTSLLEVLLARRSLDAATNQVGYLMTVSEQDKVLADEIRLIREQLEHQAGDPAARVAWRSPRRGSRRRAGAHPAPAQAPAGPREGAGSAEGGRRAEARRAGGRPQRGAGGKGRRRRADRAERGGLRQATHWSTGWSPSARRRRGAAPGRGRGAPEAPRQAKQLSAAGFRWPEVGAQVTQEWGPTNFVLEPSYTYQGVYYPHFHGGIDMRTAAAPRSWRPRRAWWWRPASRCGRGTRATAW